MFTPAIEQVTKLCWYFIHKYFYLLRKFCHIMNNLKLVDWPGLSGIEICMVLLCTW